jgi:hypothetical protein
MDKENDALRGAGLRSQSGPLGLGSVALKLGRLRFSGVKQEAGLEGTSGASAYFGGRSVGVTPAREKALANISNMDQRRKRQQEAEAAAMAAAAEAEAAALRDAAAFAAASAALRDAAAAAARDAVAAAAARDAVAAARDAAARDAVARASFASDGDAGGGGEQGAAEASPLVSEYGRGSPGGAGPAEAHHLVLGELLCDLEYKRVYKTSARRLVEGVPIWHLQRPTDPRRVAEIVAANAERCELQGVVSVFDLAHLLGPSLEHPQKMGIFDGQHRVLAVNQILKSRAPGFDFCLLVEVWPVRCELEIKRLFLELNKAEIVQEIDLPSSLASPGKLVLDEACRMLHERYRACFGDERCRAPNVHLHSLRNELFKADVLAHAPPGTGAEELLAFIERCNGILAERPDAAWPVSLQRNLPKARKTGFFLGLSKDWVHHLLVDKVLRQHDDRARGPPRIEYSPQPLPLQQQRQQQQQHRPLTRTRRS